MSDLKAAPISNSYWLREHQVLAGEYPGDRDPVKARTKVARLLDSGVRVFIDLTTPWMCPILIT